ncbi:MAG: Uma2 family endonuclease [Leadbetterella sp.]|nr:Uma2 family endonuclease [Leadbetterella sp.]
MRLPDSRKQTGDEVVFTVVQPDICVICDPAKIDDRGCIGPPDLVIEILSPGNTQKEMGIKFDLYEENGVKEYWLVEPQDRAIIVYTLKEGKYIGLKPFTEEDDISPVLFPELKFAVKDIFE